MNAETLDRCPKCQAPVPPEAPQGLCPKCLLASVSTATEAGQSSAASPPPAPEIIAEAFPQLEILGFIGQGGMGLVYKARQPKLARFVALKLLPQKAGADPAFGERFNREARVLARLSHPNIVAVHDFGQTPAFFYLLMEFVDGVNLRQAMRAGRFTPAQALALVPKICDALQYAHEEGVLHRDIKPENLLLDTRGRLKIADFGIAKMLGESKDITLTASGATIGTPHYMAPEQLERPQDVDQRADIYSLGVVFYEMLTGELPLGRFAPPSEKATIDPRVDEVVLRALEKERERRFQSAGEVKTHVENITNNPAAARSAPAPSAAQVDSGSARPVPPMSPGGTQVLGTSPADPAQWSLKALVATALVGLSLFVLGLLVLSEGHLFHGKWGVACFLIGAPAIAGTLLGGIATLEVRGAQGRLRGRRLALISTASWPILLLDALIVSSLVAIMRPLDHHLMRLTVALACSGILILDVFLLRHWMKPWSREPSPSDVLGSLNRVPRAAVWVSGVAVLGLLLIFWNHQRSPPELQAVPVPPFVDPTAPSGYEVPQGSPPSSEGDRVFRTSVSVPAGYALSVAGLLRSNQVVVPLNDSPAVLFMIAPANRPAQGSLTWRLLANTTLADGAPLEFGLGSVPEPEGRRKSLHLVPPEPLSVDWVGEPIRAWPPLNGRTKFLVLRAWPEARPAEGEAPSEWTFGIEVRLDPVPQHFRKLTHVVIGVGTNWLSTFDENTPAQPDDPERVSQR